MARVPDVLEALQPCYSENEGFISDLDQASLAQDSFYPSSSSHHKEKWSSSEFSKKAHQLNFQEDMEAPVSKRKNKKMRHPFNNDYLFENVSLPEKDKDLTKCTSASFAFQNKMDFRFISYTFKQILNDQNAQGIIQTGMYLKAVPIQGMTREVIFDIGKYANLGPIPQYVIPVTLRISNTNLYVAARKKNEPVYLEEIPETPQWIDGSQSNILFYQLEAQNYSTFNSVANPELYLATSPMEDQMVHMAEGLPSLIHFLVSDA
ncbi:interleukin-1 alpha [Gracilinanus agilis]|uniref:interleukin-1 alpha n=1 Tax=Gracilinanus agilis TaxID=191870 RepID=UPI001CFC7AB4|nr:interleukin-1 alpha [Gracilinanus agilis]